MAAPVLPPKGDSNGQGVAEQTTVFDMGPPPRFSRMRRTADEIHTPPPGLALRVGLRARDVLILQFKEMREQ
jgi:hypothetical protein